MRYLILSDIHANLAALEAVLAAAAGAYDVVLNCGDLVGYGPDPNAVIDFARATCRTVVRGNHDKAVAGSEDIDWFNPIAKAAVLWTRSVLRPDNLAYLEALPAGPVEVDGFSLVHGSPADEDEYVTEDYEVDAAVEAAITGLSFLGHTHLQGGWFIKRDSKRQLAGDEVLIEDTATYLINPGSVGQPRDSDPRAAYAIYNSADRVVFLRRAAYDVDATCRKMLDAGLPEPLARRLYSGR